MSRLLGLHVNSLPGGLLELLATWRPPLVVTLVPGPAWAWLKAASPRTLIVYRHIEGEHPGLTPAQRINEAITAAAGMPLDYLQLTNEPHIPDREALATLAAWEAEAIRYAAGKGIKLAIGNFSVGNPSDLSWWEAYHPALEAGRAHGAALNLHEYNFPSLQSDDALWYNLRHRQVYALLPEHLRLPLIIGECGLDAGTRGGGAYGSWTGHVDPDQYASQLEQWDLQLQADPYVFGAAIFMAGQPDKWWAFNVWPEPAGTLARRADPLYRSYGPPAISQPPAGTADLITSLPRGPIPYGTRTRKGINLTVLHYSWVTPPKPDREHEIAQIQSIAAGHLRRGWPGIAYHFIVGPSGIVYEVNHLEAIAAHAGNWNHRSVGICCLLRDKPPTPAQVLATAQLIRKLGHEAKPHNALIKTGCPGKYLWDQVRKA